MNGVFDAADAFLLGRVTYQAMAGFWPQVTDPANRGRRSAAPRPPRTVRWATT